MLFINNKNLSKYKVLKDYYKFKLRFLIDRIFGIYPKRYIYGNHILPDLASKRISLCDKCIDIPHQCFISVYAPQPITKCKHFKHK